MKLSDLTVIVPTKNEVHNIGPFLASLHPDVALVVVDASDDETPALIAAHPHPAKLIRSLASLGAARQLGAEAADTPWMLFTDADVSFAPDYWQTLSRLVIRHYGAVYGPKLSTTAHVGHYRRFSRGMLLLDRLGIPAASGSNLLIARRALSAAGGFDVSLRCNEDSEVCWRIKQWGYEVRYEPRLVVLARDHRRLARGGWRKDLHSLTRCALLYTGLMPERWRAEDWGYWQSTAASKETALLPE